MTELNKESVCIGESSVAVFSQAYCETDIIVPDVNPDIVKVLQVSANTGIFEKNCSLNRIALDGKAEMVILYLGDDENVYSITTSRQFSHIIDANGVSEDMFAEAEISADNVDYTIINSRKINIKVLMGIDINAVKEVNADLCTDISADEPFEILNKTITPYKTVNRVTEQLCIRERLEIPTGQPSINRILRVDGCIRDKSCIVASDKMMIQGTLCLSAIYLGDTDGRIYTAEYDVPFTEVIAIPDADEGMKASVRLCINRIFYKPEADDDGDCRYIFAECMITANAKVCYGYSLNIIQDAYCIRHPIKVIREATKVNRLITESKNQISAKDVVVLTDDMPEILQIFNVTPNVYLGSAKIEDSKAVIEGIIESDIMYISSEPASPVNTYRHQQHFSHTVDISCVGEDMVCDVLLDVVHSNYTISMGREIDLRFVLEISVDVLSSETVEYITDIQNDDTEKYDAVKSYCIKIYFVKKGDNLWNIAKKYHISKEALMEINNINEDSEIYDGRQIMIPIK